MPEPTNITTGATLPSPGFVSDVGPPAPGITADEAREAIAAGIPRAAVEAALKAGGLDPATALAEPTVETNEDLAALDAGGLRSVTQEELSVSIAYSHDVVAGYDAAELQAFDQSAKAAAVDMRLPPASAVSTIQSLVEAAARADAIPADQRQAFNDLQDRRLIMAMGSEEAAKHAVDLAAKAVARIRDTAFIERLNASGVLRDPLIITALAHAEDVTATRHLMHEGKATVRSVIDALVGA